MTFEELKQKASSLPMSPGVYIMRDKSNQVIYVGKAKKLRNRVSQYFVDTVSHTVKTRMMISRIWEFDIIVATSEFEALVLESSLIKRHMPKYNILLKDDKGYPYIRLDTRFRYPRISIANKPSNDGAAYYGPYGSRHITQSLIDAILITLKLPNCIRAFPRDIGKNRVCLNFHMKPCEGWCRGNPDEREYNARIEQAKYLLQGNFKQVSNQIKEQMLEASERLQFELAAGMRDRLKAVEALGQKQLVTAGSLADTDVIGFYQNDSKACFLVLHYSGGNLLDKEYEILETVDDEANAVSELLVQFYLNRGYAPKVIFLPYALEDMALIEQLLTQKYNHRTRMHIPQRGDNVKLIQMAQMNAREEVERITSKEERINATLSLLAKMLNLSELKRIEAYDISNTAGTDIVGGMVVFVDGKPKKSEYKRFSIRNLQNQDDYASMHQVITRRFTHFLEGDAGFLDKPDLLLIDGGITHAQTALDALNKLGISIPVFGMVKDDRHRTRALVTPEGLEIRIDSQQIIFALIGKIQEETHRFAITYHRKKRANRMRYSKLDQIPGIGPKRKQQLLNRFKSISAIKLATLEDLLQILPADAANSVYRHFREGE